MKAKLDSLGIYNEWFIYNEGHGGWDWSNIRDRHRKMKAFMKQHTDFLK